MMTDSNGELPRGNLREWELINSKGVKEVQSFNHSPWNGEADGAHSRSLSFVTIS